MGHRFIFPDGRPNKAAIDQALGRRLALYARFSHQIPGLITAAEWLRDVRKALRAEIEVEQRQHDRSANRHG